MAMATENVVIDRPDEETESGLWGGVKSLFSFGPEYDETDAGELAYERRLWDRRIERYLDSSLPDYLHDFGVLDEIALHVRDERASDLAARSREMMVYARTLDEDLTLQEERLTAVEKAAKKRSS